jgi:hypothetical protein
MRIKRFAQHVNEGSTQFFKGVKWKPYEKIDGKAYFTNPDDDNEYPAIYGEDEIKLFKDGYGVEYEFRASRYSDEKAEATVKELADGFADVKYIKTYPDEFGGLYRFFTKPKSVNEESNKHTLSKLGQQFDWQDFDNTDLSGPSWDSKCEDFVNEFKSVMSKEMPAHTYSRGERKKALSSLLTLFKQQIDRAVSDANNESAELDQDDSLYEAAYIPSNILEWLKHDATTAQSAAAKKVAAWVSKSGSFISGGTSIGKRPQTLILDIKREGSEIYINSDGEIQFDGTVITSPKQFQTAFDAYKKSTPELRKYFKIEA